MAGVEVKNSILQHSLRIVIPGTTLVPNNALFYPKFEKDKRAKQMTPPDLWSTPLPNLKVREAP